MSTIERDVATCRSKLSFRTRKRAVSYEMHFRDTHPESADRLYPYECEVCGRFHLSKSMGRAERARLDRRKAGL